MPLAGHAYWDSWTSLRRQEELRNQRNPAKTCKKKEDREVLPRDLALTGEYGILDADFKLPD